MSSVSTAALDRRAAVTSGLRRSFLVLAALLLTGGAAWAEDTKGKLGVVFLGGFKDEQVEIFVGSQKVYSSTLTTSPVTGAAGEISLASTEKLIVSVPRLSLRQMISLTPDGGHILSIVLNENKLEFEQRKTPVPLD